MTDDAKMVGEGAGRGKDAAAGGPGAEPMTCLWCRAELADIDAPCDCEIDPRPRKMLLDYSVKEFAAKVHAMGGRLELTFRRPDSPTGHAADIGKLYWIVNDWRPGMDAEVRLCTGPTTSERVAVCPHLHRSPRAAESCARRLLRKEIRRLREAFAGDLHTALRKEFHDADR